MEVLPARVQQAGVSVCWGWRRGRRLHHRWWQQRPSQAESAEQDGVQTGKRPRRVKILNDQKEGERREENLDAASLTAKERGSCSRRWGGGCLVGFAGCCVKKNGPRLLTESQAEVKGPGAPSW